jgi:hypothetical protein
MKKAKVRKLPIRLALRQEGDWWNAYIAQQDTMTDAHLIGSILIGPVRGDRKLKQRFMDLMTDVMAMAVEEITGRKPDHTEVQEAPESERSGNA